LIQSPGSRAGNEADATGPGRRTVGGQQTPYHWFNTAAFADPPFTRFGNAGAHQRELKYVSMWLKVRLAATLKLIFHKNSNVYLQLISLASYKYYLGATGKEPGSQWTQTIVFPMQEHGMI
jgi:hypothetical protein